MSFEWDEQKNQANIAKHGYDFEDVSKTLLEGAFIYEYLSSYALEKRTIAISEYEGQLVAIIYTLRGDNIRIISIRKARQNERKDYEKAKRENR